MLCKAEKSGWNCVTGQDHSHHIKKTSHGQDQGRQDAGKDLAVELVVHNQLLKTEAKSHHDVGTSQDRDLHIEFMVSRE